MSLSVYIIHGSEIIRKGLCSILADLYMCEIFQENSLEKFDIFSSLQNQDSIFLIDINHEDQLDCYHISSKESEYFFLITNEKISKQEKNCKFKIVSIYDSKEDIHAILNRKIKKEYFRSSKNSNTDLTNREKDILKLVASGLSNKEISEKLFISFHTVTTHRKNITEKLSIKSISGLTIYALINGIIDQDSTSQA